MKLEHFAPVMEWWDNRTAINVEALTSPKYTVQQLTEDFGYNLDLCGIPHEEEEILDPRDLIQRYQEERASLNTKIDSVLNNITTLLQERKNDAAGT